jgi:hypothetical protein
MKVKRLFYDIETSFCQGHFWRPGWNQTIHPHQITEHAKIISIHWSWEGSEKVYNVHWGLDKQCDKKPLQKFLKELAKADEVCTHNGKRFDTPWLRTRAIFHGLEMMPEYREIDTYKLAKKYLNLPSYSLAECCNYYGLESKKDAGGIQTWVDVVYNKKREALNHLLYYGDGDILSLKALYYKLMPYIKPHTHHAVARGGDKYDCPNCGCLPSHNKTYTTAAGTIKHYMRCLDCKTKFVISNKSYDAFNIYLRDLGVKRLSKLQRRKEA